MAQYTNIKSELNEALAARRKLANKTIATYTASNTGYSFTTLAAINQHISRLQLTLERMNDTIAGRPAHIGKMTYRSGK